MDEQEALSLPQWQGLEPVGSGERVLLIDDEEPLVRLGRRLLEALGYEAIVHQHGEDALEFAAQSEERIDLLITDVAMPKINGIEVARRIRAIRPDVPIIFMSGLSETDLLRREGVPTGIERIIKPFSLVELQGAILRALNSSRRSEPTGNMEEQG